MMFRVIRIESICRFFTVLCLIFLIPCKSILGDFKYFVLKDRKFSFQAFSIGTMWI